MSVQSRSGVKLLQMSAVVGMPDVGRIEHSSLTAF